MKLDHARSKPDGFAMKLPDAGNKPVPFRIRLMSTQITRRHQRNIDCSGIPGLPARLLPIPKHSLKKDSARPVREPEEPLRNPGFRPPAAESGGGSGKTRTGRVVSIEVPATADAADHLQKGSTRCPDVRIAVAMSPHSPRAASAVAMARVSTA